MQATVVSILGLICLDAGDVASVEQAPPAALPLVFWNPADVTDSVGRIRFGTEPLRPAGRATGFPDMQYGCDVPDKDGTTRVYGWRFVNWTDRPRRTLEVIRCRTSDGRTFTDTQTVFRHVNKDWQGFSNIVHRPTDGALFLFSWAPGALHVFRSDNGTDWRLLTDKAYGDHDAMCVIWHPGLGAFVNYQHTLQPYKKRYPDNIGNHRRIMSFRRSEDGVAWTSFSPPFLEGASRWMPDEHDPVDLEFYRCVVFPLHGRYAMLLVDYMPHPQEANPRRATTKHSSRYLTEWAISPDGIDWERPFREIDAVEAVAWTAVQGPLVRDNALLFYDVGGQIASLPADRVFYVTCRSNGHFSTPLFTMPPNGLTLNAYAQYRPAESPGQAVIMAELRDGKDNVIPGYEMSNCLIENRQGRAIALEWDAKIGKEFAGRPVRLRFFLRDARIYGVSAR